MNPFHKYQQRQQEPKKAQERFTSFVANLPETQGEIFTFAAEFAQDMKPQIFEPAPKHIEAVIPAETKLFPEKKIILRGNQLEAIETSNDNFLNSVCFHDMNFNYAVYKLAMAQYLGLKDPKKLPLATIYSGLLCPDGVNGLILGVRGLADVEKDGTSSIVHLNSGISLPVNKGFDRFQENLELLYKCMYIAYGDYSVEPHCFRKYSPHRLLDIEVKDYNKAILEKIANMEWLRPHRTFANLVKHYEMLSIVSDPKFRNAYTHPETMELLQARSSVQNQKELARILGEPIKKILMP